MGIEQYLDLSTAHVEKEVMNPPGVVSRYRVATYEYGAFFYVPAPSEIHPDTPPGLAAVLKYAWCQGCCTVRLDCDGDIIEALPVFDW